MIEQTIQKLRARPHRWLVTGAAGFIGSNLVEALLKLGQEVVGLDNLATGHESNLREVQKSVGADTWTRFTFIEGDICDPEPCERACRGVDFVLHQAALGSVPRSIADPAASNRANVDGFLNMLIAAKDAGVRRFVYASSSSVYGDDALLPKIEERCGAPLSPYAATKAVNEIYAKVFALRYNLASVGLRYFNVFGPRQDPNGPYAAVIPRWIAELLNHRAPVINGDGSISRDFCFVENVVQANLLAATCETPAAINQVYNIACGESTSLNELCQIIRDYLGLQDPVIAQITPIHGQQRPGDIAHSLADITKARQLLGYEPVFDARAGLALTLDWYLQANAQPSQTSEAAQEVSSCVPSAA